MEENIKIKPFFRGLGICICLFIIVVTVWAFFQENKPPTYDLLTWLLSLALLLPACIVGYIPGKLLDKLPKFLVKAIKLDFKIN